MKSLIAICALLLSLSVSADDKASAASALSVYGAVWNQTDPAVKNTLLDLCWSEKSTYTDPNTHVSGREGLAAYVLEFQTQFPGAQLVWTSRVEEHHGWFRASWSIVGEDGSELLTGQDFGQMAEDGKLLRIVGFFDRVTASPETTQ